MLQRILRWLTIALLAVSFNGNNSSASPLEDSLAAPAKRDACMKEFVPLRKEAEERGKLIKAASARHAPPDEACELIGNFGQSEIKMIEYIDANSAKCGIPPQAADQLRAGHKNTEAVQKKVCAVAHPISPERSRPLRILLEQQPQRREPAGPVGDFDDTGAPPLVR
jgi:hypothetical protein